MSKNLYKDILRSHKKIEQQSSKNGFILNQFFLTKKFESRKDRLYNIAKNAGSISSGFFILYFLTKTKIKIKTKRASTNFYILTLNHMKNIPQTFKQNLKLNFASLPGKKLTKSHIKLLVKQVKQKMNEEKEKGIIWPTN